MIKKLTMTGILVSLFLSITLISLAQGPEELEEPRPTHLAGSRDEPQVESSQNISQQTTPYALYGSGDFFFPPYPSESERAGYGKTSNHDTSALNAGWYIDWGASKTPAHPGGAEYARTIYFKVSAGGSCKAATQHSQVTTTYTGTALINNVIANPGALWVIGNEPDSFYNGSPIHPELYAELYHYFYHTIKETDPTAKVAVASIVQASPLRMEYLDNIRDHYQATYGEALESDLWNIHFYRFNEGRCNSSWGASVPPGASSNQGWNIGFSAGSLLNLTALEASLRDFRQWMYDRGYGDTPLIITEYGVLPPPSYGGFSNAVATQFLHDTFNMFRTATDPVTGLASDGDRIIQAWNWFSTDHAPPAGYFKYGGDLFNADNSLTVIGDGFLAEAQAHNTPYIDLQPVPPTEVLTTATNLSIGAYVQNRGNLTATSAQIDISLINPSNSAVLSQTSLQLLTIPKRYNGSAMALNHSWPISLTDIPTATIRVVNATADANPANDMLEWDVAWPRWRLLDLELTHLQTTPASPFFYVAGETSLQTVTKVKNTGVNASPPTTLTLTLTDIAQSLTLTAPLQAVPILQPGQSIDLQATFPISTAGAYLLSASLPTDIDPEEFPDNNQLSQTITAIDRTQITFSKQAPFLASVGEAISYTLSVTNNSSFSLSNILLTDALPPGANYISGGQLNGNTVEWMAPILAENGGVFSAHFVVSATHTVINNDYHFYTEGDIHLAGDKAIVTLIEGNTPILKISKTAPEATVSGAYVTYTLKVTNGSPVTLTNVVITDIIPSGASYITGGTRLGDEVSWLVPAIAPNNGHAEVSFVVTTTNTITNTHYKATIAEGLSADGTEAVVTKVGDGTIIIPGPGDSVYIITDTFSTGVPRHLRIEIPNSAVSETLIANYTKVGVPQPPIATPYLWYQDLRFYLDVYQGTIILPGFTLNRSITMTVTYTDTGINDESKLGLYYFDAFAGEWVSAASTCGGSGSLIIHDTAQNQITTQVCRLGQFAFMQEVYPLFMPLIFKGL